MSHMQVNASDADVGRNAEITYVLADLEPEDTQGQGQGEGRGWMKDDGEGVCVEKFVIDSESGAVTARTRLDHEQRSVYRCRVLAIDAGQPPNTGLSIQYTPSPSHRATCVSYSSLLLRP